MSDAESRTPDEIRADIEATREELGDTVEALSAKTDVKARAHDKTEEVKAKVKDALPGGGADGGETPPAAEKAQELGGAAANAARDNVLPLAIAGALILGYLIGRRAAR